MKGGAYLSPFAALSFPNSKKVPIYCWVDRESFPVAAWRSRASNSRDTATFWSIAELKVKPIPLLSLPYPSLIRKRFPFTAGLTERVFQSPHGEAEPRTHAIGYGDFLRYSRAALTTRPRRLSKLQCVYTKLFSIRLLLTNTRYIHFTASKFFKY